VPFGDPWTPAQRALVDVVIKVWNDTGGSWPLYQYVASVLEDQHLNATQVLRSFPSLGARGSTQRAYADVNFDHIHPSPPDESKISLSVSGLHRHPLGEQSAQAFVAVLSYVAERWAQTPRDPSKVVQVKVTSEEAVAALARWPAVFIQTTMSVIRTEPVAGIRHMGEDPNSQSWDITVGQGISRYRDLTVERYLAMIQEEYGATRQLAVTSANDSFANTVASLSSRLLSPNAGVHEMPGMSPEWAIRELEKLKEESGSPEIQHEGPANDRWKAKVRTVLERALGPGSSVLRDFQEVRYTVGVWTGSPGEDERDRQYFAQQVKSAVAYVDAAIYELKLSIAPEDALRQSQPAQSPAADEAAIFLVHGHDKGAKHEVARFLERVTGRAPIILDEQASAGNTLVEKFERYASTSSYAVVLVTPDDLGRVSGSTQEADRPRARQNVVFELGYFFGKLGRGRVAVINAGVEKPSDVEGLVYIPYPESNWQFQLANELQEAGIRIDHKRLLG
jgi:predicted nucleotide-binding protein